MTLESIAYSSRFRYLAVELPSNIVLKKLKPNVSLDIPLDPSISGSKLSFSDGSPLSSSYGVLLPP